MAKRDLYEVLELSKGASVAEIKKAYKRLARKLHPDVNPGDRTAEERFKELNEAYGILSHPDKKKQYDLYGSAGPEPPPGPRVNYTGFDFDAGRAGGFEDLLEAFVHAADSPGEAGPQPGSDLIYPLTVSLEEAYAGKKARIAIAHTVTCAACRGEGRVEVSRKKACGQCGGSGKVGLSHGPFSFARPCPACGGTGRDPGRPCPSCGGSGAQPAKDTVEVAIPPGVDTGSRVRLKGKGQAGQRGGPPGDLYIETHVLPHAVFSREGLNLKMPMLLTYPEAVLGGRVEVPTLAGGAWLRIPPGTSSGQVFRLRGRGMPSVRGGPAGDLLVVASIAVPSVTDERSKELLREFERLNPENPRASAAGSKR